MRDRSYIYVEHAVTFGVMVTMEQMNDGVLIMRRWPLRV